MSRLSTVDVAAIRLWLDTRVQPETPSNVMAGFDEGVGATFFDLNTLQVNTRPANPAGTDLLVLTASKYKISKASPPAPPSETQYDACLCMCVRLHSILHMRQHYHPVAKKLPSASSVTLF